MKIVNLDNFNSCTGAFFYLFEAAYIVIAEPLSQDVEAAFLCGRVLDRKSVV